MFKHLPAHVFIAVLVLASAACGSTGVPTSDPNLLNTMVAQTIAAIQVETALAGTDTPTPTPTFTPTVTLSPTPVFTETPPVPLISVTVNTNCRVGPGKAYDRIGALLVGETTQIYGRDLAGNYWYVANPDVSGGFCWLWGEYATLAGNTLTLPIFTPPPTPTPVPGFDAEYINLETCTGKWWVEFKLMNTGGIVFRSISLTVLDEKTGTPVALTGNELINNDGCSASNSRKSLDIGEAFTVSAPPFSYDPTGHKLRATLTLCSEDGVNGICVTQVIEFKP